MKPFIKIILDDGTNTNVTIVPVRQNDLTGVLLATGEAVMWFTRGLVQDEESINKRMQNQGGG